MRLRYLAIDYFCEDPEPSNKSSRSSCVRVPTLPCLGTRSGGCRDFYRGYVESMTLVEKDLTFLPGFRDGIIFDKTLVEVKNTYQKFLKEIFPSRISEPIVKVRVHEELAKVSSWSHTNAFYIDNNHESSHDGVASITTLEAPLLFEQKQNLSFPQMIGKEMEVPVQRLPELVESTADCLSRPFDVPYLISESKVPAAAPAEAHETSVETIPLVLKVVKLCMLMLKNPDNIYEGQVLVEDAHFEQFDEKDELSITIPPFELHEVEWDTSFWFRSGMTSLVTPVGLLQEFEAHERLGGHTALEKLSFENFLDHGDLNDKLKSILLPDKSLLKQATVQDLVPTNFDVDLNRAFADEPLKDKDFCDEFLKVQPFEIPMPYVRRSYVSALRNVSIIAESTSPRHVEDLPNLCTTKCFDTMVTMPDLMLDDHRFQSFPVHLLADREYDRHNVALGRLISSDCESSVVLATDWLYLDWHFFFGLKCSNAACFNLQSQLTEFEEFGAFACSFERRDGVAQTHRKETDLPILLDLLEDDQSRGGSSLSNWSLLATDGRVSLPHGATTFKHGPKTVRNPKDKDDCTNSVISRGDFCKSHDAPLSQPSRKSNISQGDRWPLEISKRNLPEIPVCKENCDIYDSQPRGMFVSPSTCQASRFPSKHGDIRGIFEAVDNSYSNEPVRKTEVQPASPHLLDKVGDDQLQVKKKGPESISGDLDYFVQARKGTLPKRTVKSGGEDNRGNSDVLGGLPYFLSPGSTGPAAIREHRVGLSGEIRKCLSSLASNYSEILGHETCFRAETSQDLKVPEEFRFDADSNKHLSSLICNGNRDSPSHSDAVLTRGLIALHVLQCTALNLCDYGIQVAHLYLENFIERMSFLEAYIVGSRVKLEEAYNDVERGVLEDHPKLSLVETLLRPMVMKRHQDKSSSLRILLLADRRGFFTLIRKLVSIGLTPYQIDRKEKYLQDGALREASVKQLNEEVVEALHFSDCLLVSYMYLNPSFPVWRFTAIIQYADPQNADIEAGILTGEYGDRHVFKTVLYPEEPGSSSSNSALRYQDGLWQSPQPPFHDRAKCLNVSEQETVSSLGGDSSPGPASISDQMHFKQVVPEELPSTPGNQSPSTRGSSNRCTMIIVVNISPPCEWLTARRHSFQKILNFEKESIQVVERELRLPVDLIASPASCLIIYTLGKLNLHLQELLQRQSTFRNEVTTHLKAISFSFRECIVIFEGPTEFTSAALDFFDHLYALAIAFEMNIRCFASRHPEITDMIISKCIEASRIAKRMPSFPMMTEGPTLAETFLTEYPSINPLTAHAILSSGWPLPSFISLPRERQFAVVQEFDVPQQCLDLFKVQCTASKAVTSDGMLACNGMGYQISQPSDRLVYFDQSEEAHLLDNHPPIEGRKYLPELHFGSKITLPSPTAVDFPEFPPASEISSCQVDSPERDETIFPGFGDLDIHKHPSDSENAGLAFRRSSPMSAGEANEFSPFVVDPEPFGGQSFLNRIRSSPTKGKVIPSNNPASGQICVETGMETDPFKAGNLEFHNFANRAEFENIRPGVHNQSVRGHCMDGPWTASILGDGPLYSGPGNLADCRSGFGAQSWATTKDLKPFGAPNFLFESPFLNSGTDLGKQGDDNMFARNFTETFMEDNIDLSNNDDVSLQLSTSPSSFENLSGCDEWDEWATVSDGGIPTSIPFRQPTQKRPPTLPKSSLDKFRYQAKAPATRAALDSRTQTKLRFPSIVRPNSSRMPPMTTVNFATKRSSTQRAGKDLADQRRNRALGCARLGTDPQLRLVWKQNASLASKKRRKTDVS